MSKKNALFILNFIAIVASAQTTKDINYENPKAYEIGGITISGIEYLNNSALITISGLVMNALVAELPSLRAGKLRLKE